MFDQNTIRFRGARYSAVAMMILLLLAVAPLAAAMGRKTGATYSGDDAYDPAAGGNPEGFATALACATAADQSLQ